MSASPVWTDLGYADLDVRALRCSVCRYRCMACHEGARHRRACPGLDQFLAVKERAVAARAAGRPRPAR